uniref:Uncharacterized protein n=1 Tax=Amphimedon queenslandica TaxID=400682 RepID=A0A1X7VKS4_AMPQE
MFTVVYRGCPLELKNVRPLLVLSIIFWDGKPKTSIIHAN